MKKKIISRGLIGALQGIVIGYMITIIISAINGTGEYLPCVPNLTLQIGTETGAVILQTILCALLGAVYGGASVIWELDDWSLAKQSLVYFALAAAAMLPIAYLTHWMEHSLRGILLYTAIFIFIFLLVWLVQYIIWKNKVKKLNKSLHRE